ncbi:MAG: elongation factor P, partial [Myxococcota bacterium]
NFQHVKPGKGGAFVRTKLKNLRNGKVFDKTFRAGEKVEAPDIEERKMQFLYFDGDSLVFMDNETYDQIPFTVEQVGESRKYLMENLDCEVLFWNGKPINVELPSFIEAEITQCDPGMKGDTAQGATKPATIETGAVVTVPLFLREGERIRVDTRTGDYVERVG